MDNITKVSGMVGDITAMEVVVVVVLVSNTPLLI